MSVRAKRVDFTTSIPGRVTEVLVDGQTSVKTPISRYCTEKVTSSSNSRAKPSGWVPPTSYAFTRTQYVCAHGTFHFSRYWGGRRVSGSDLDGTIGGTDSAFTADSNAIGAATPPNWFDPPQSMRDKALIKARLKMKTGDVNLGIAFAERNRTAKLVADTATQLVCSMRHLRRGNFRAASGCLTPADPRKPRGSSIPERWLELQYGWRPLLQDVYGSVEALTRQPRDNWIVTAKGVVKEPAPPPYSREYRDSGSGVGRLDVSMKGWRGVHARIDAVPKNDLVLALSSLGITNPALIGWELVPFSFVVDWFLPIGQYLESLDAMLGYGDSWSCISSFARCEYTVKRTGITYGQPGYEWVTKVNASDGKRTTVKLDRVASQGVPLPTMPRLRDGRTLTRMANALSLLSQTFAGRR